MPFHRGFRLDDAFLDIVAQAVEVSSVPNAEPNERVVEAVVRDTLSEAAGGQTADRHLLGCRQLFSIIIFIEFKMRLVEN